MRRTHVLKSWPRFFEEVIAGRKTFELRINDRDYRVGDQLLLREWDEQTKEYTGRRTLVEVPYILGTDSHCAVSPVAITRGYVVMSVRPVYKEPAA
jgi:hypothetical protein